MTLTPDRRFGYINKFGDTNKFGASGTGEQLSWVFEVDWNGDGAFVRNETVSFNTGG